MITDSKKEQASATAYRLAYPSLSDRISLWRIQ